MHTHPAAPRCRPRRTRAQLKWTFENELDLVFVAVEDLPSLEADRHGERRTKFVGAPQVYLNMTQMLYMDELMAAVKRDFAGMFRYRPPPPRPPMNAPAHPHA